MFLSAQTVRIELRVSLGCTDMTDILFKIIEDTPLSFKYTQHSKDIYKAEDHQEGIDAADQQGIIEVIQWNTNNNHKYSGNPEPLFNNGKLCFATPTLEGKEIEIKPFGEYACRYCGHINFVPQEKGKLLEPHECQGCERKGQFKRLFPEELMKPIWKVANAPLEAGAHEIYGDIYQYLKDHLILKEDEYHIIALWIMASWLVDEFDTVPYLLFIAPKSSGKTQALNVIHELGYRSYLTVSVTAAAIFRASDLWHITPLIDESEFQLNTDTPSESGQALYGLLNGGYKRGNSALRVEGEARIPTSFDIFGFKAIASTKVFLPTLESRSIIINMTQGMPENILINTERSKLIRAKLVYFRFSTLTKLKTIMPKSTSGRLTELFIPLFTTAQTLVDIPGRKQTISYDSLMLILNNKLKSMESERTDEEKGSSEAQVVEAILNLQKLNVDGITAKAIAKEVNWVSDNEEKAFRGTVQKIGFIIKTLGIKTIHSNMGNIINFNDEKTSINLNELKRRYKL